MTTPAFLCEHPDANARSRAFRRVCATCGSYWDVDSLGEIVPYDAGYPEQRGHYDPRVGALKARTLRDWLRRGGIALEGKRACEVGFGGGSCLPVLAERAASVVGLEANDAAIERVRVSGVRAELLSVFRLPPRLDAPIDLWVFQDSFEHIPDPAAFLDWMLRNSAPNSQILMVLPRGDSFSQRLLGRLWPHKLPDHQFQWSRAGVLDFMRRRGFVAEREFYPLKFVSPQMVVAHFLHKFGAPPSVKKFLGGFSLALRFNFGEMGFVFRRRDA